MSKEMTPKEMFNEIGYYSHDNVDDCLTFVKKQGSAVYYIEFYLEEFSYESYGIAKGHNINNPIDVKMHSAIAQQIKELGWLE